MKRLFLTVALLVCVCGGALAWSRSANALSLPQVVAANNTASVSLTELSVKARASWPWYATRASGLTAAVLLVLLVLSGIGQLTGYSYRLMEPLVSWSLHRALAIAFGACVVVHGTVLMFDKYAPFNIWQVLIPFKSHYKPAVVFGAHFGSLYVAYGIISSYLVAILIYTSLFWINKRQSSWRLLHYLGYLVALLVFMHGLYVGTDLSHGIMRAIWWGFGVAVGIGIISRLRRTYSIKQPK